MPLTPLPIPKNFLQDTAHGVAGLKHVLTLKDCHIRVHGYLNVVAFLVNFILPLARRVHVPFIFLTWDTPDISNTKPTKVMCNRRPHEFTVKICKMCLAGGSFTFETTDPTTRAPRTWLVKINRAIDLEKELALDQSAPRRMLPASPRRVNRRKGPG